MVKVTNALTTYDVAGLRQDISNTIFNISPWETPFQNTVGKRKLIQPTFDWQTETLPTVNTTPDLQGFTLSNSAATITTKLTNNTMLMHRDATISNTEEASANAGQVSPMARQITIMGHALKTDVESACVGNNPRTTGATSTAPVTRGFEHWLATAGVNFNGASPAGGTAAAAGGATSESTADTTALNSDTTVNYQAFTQTLLTNAQQNLYNVGGDPSILMVGAYQMQNVATFAGRSQSVVYVGDKVASNVVDIYRSSYGTLKVMGNRFQRATTALLINPDYVKIATLRPFSMQKMAITGDAITNMLTVEFGVEVSNPKAHARIVGIPDNSARVTS
jgi:hypothetical protein